MPDRIGPHLLGRRPSPPDERDWTVERVHEVLAPSDALLDETVRQAIDDSPFFRSWSGILALWRWIKTHLRPAPGPTPTPPPTPTLWADPVVLDQGDYGTCVGNGGAGFLASEPVLDPDVDEALARRIYYEATVIDGTPDDPDAEGGGQMGSTVRSLAKALQDRRRIAAYAWAATVSEVDEWLDNHGPVVLGIDWTRDMFRPDDTGLIRATGPVEGGHCLVIRYRVPGTTRYRLRNSWGRGWGLDGDCEIERSDLGLLLAGIESRGEALVAAELPL